MMGDAIGVYIGTVFRYNRSMKDFLGVFDSGLGGITVLADVLADLPAENIVYMGDSLHAPYGEKSREEIVRLSERICQDLIDEGAKAILIACNTATSAAVDVLRSRFAVPIIGMEPALKPAVEHSHGGKILVLATAYTISNKKYFDLQERVVSHEQVIPIAAPALVRFVEEGIYSGERMQNYLDEILHEHRDAESIVLGCTHFLYLKEALNTYFGRKMMYYDGNRGTINHLKRQIELSDRAQGSLEIRNSLSEEMVELSKCMLKTYQEMSTGWTGNSSNRP